MNPHRRTTKRNPDLEPLLHRPQELDLLLGFARKEIADPKTEDSPWNRRLIACNLWLFWIYSNLASPPSGLSIP